MTPERRYLAKALPLFALVLLWGLLRWMGVVK